jgi:hypothetical protein
MSVEDRLEHALQSLLVSNDDITARAVSRKMSVAATTITRIAARMELVKKYQADQNHLRRIAASADKDSKENLVKKLAEQARLIEDLERKVQILTASHRAMLVAVGEVGGMTAWHRFFQKHEAIRSELHNLNAMPSGNVRQIHPRAKEDSDR